ncbi:chromate resistance protein ChrB domain-containing protein [Sulfuriferula sp.]|uniref:chromate resistance protein ChrB domain-containing protein n=1 Tax=Sulfuriferula sp. TaxID=2025307 RepID=UPI002730458F|nr:chromate resistance protein ChrB domain-containing protein [Sulfuriferula sp.]MDP2025378.1 chromate resistance protein [Sulfuriferula sp.]
MQWITRARPKIDRIACPWLIARFIDRHAEFLYVSADEVLKIAQATGATPYDIPGVEMGHNGELCSFDAFLKKYQLTDPALQQLASIVRGADTSRLDLAPQAAGLLAISLGLSHNFPDDHEMLKQGIVIYDALYAWCQALPNETHNWPPVG